VRIPFPAALQYGHCGLGRKKGPDTNSIAGFRYGIERDDVDYIIETFQIVKKKDIQKYGEYRTKLVILDIYDKMKVEMDTGEAYQTLLDPPPADPSVAHPDTRPENVAN